MEKLYLLIAVALLAVGCYPMAHVESAPGHYSVSGTTDRPEAAIYAASQAYVETKNADEYWKAVQQGRAYPYMGGVYGYNDYQYYYGGIMPAPQTAPAPAAVGSGNDATEAKQMAEDALKAIIEHTTSGK